MLPDLSVTVHVTIVSPNGNICGASLLIITSCISLTSGSASTASLPVVNDDSRVISLTKISGATVSTIMTFCDEVAKFPEVSVAVQVTTV